MPEPVRSKRDMYHRLSAGEFGNHNPAFYDLESWHNSPEKAKYELWGIRSMAVADRRLRLDIHRDEVPAGIAVDFQQGFNLSPMVDPWLTFRGEVWESPEGLRLFGVRNHKEVKWREAFKYYGIEYQGLRARMMLLHLFWPGDYDDLQELLHNYPGHCIEFTACDRAVGTCPNRNVIIWECRCSTGEYERWI